MLFEALCGYFGYICLIEAIGGCAVSSKFNSLFLADAGSFFFFTCSGVQHREAAACWSREKEDPTRIWAERKAGGNS